MTRRTRIPSLGPRGEGWVALQLLLLGAIFVLGLATGPNWIGPLRTAAAVSGALMLVYGLALLYLGIRDLGQSLSPLPRPRDAAVLIQGGVYGRLRHPIYAALILMAFGWSLVTAAWLALGLSVALAVILDLKARREEAWLRERFDGYEDYARRTRRFVPGLY